MLRLLLRVVFVVLLVGGGEVWASGEDGRQIVLFDQDSPSKDSPSNCLLKLYDLQSQLHKPSPVIVGSEPSFMEDYSPSCGNCGYIPTKGYAATPGYPLSMALALSSIGMQSQPFRSSLFLTLPKEVPESLQGVREQSSKQSNRETKVDATVKQLRKDVIEGQFNEDKFDQLNEQVVKISTDNAVINTFDFLRQKDMARVQAVEEELEEHKIKVAEQIVKIETLNGVLDQKVEKGQDFLKKQLKSAQLELKQLLTSSESVLKEKIQQESVSVKFLLVQTNTSLKELLEQGDQAVRRELKQVDKKLTFLISKTDENLRVALEQERATAKEELRLVNEALSNRLNKIDAQLLESQKTMVTLAQEVGASQGNTDLMVQWICDMQNLHNDLEWHYFDTLRETSIAISRHDVELENIQKELEEIKNGKPETIFAMNLFGFQVVSLQGRNTWSAATKAYMACLVSVTFNRMLPQLASRIPLESFGSSSQYVATLAGGAGMMLFTLGTSIVANKTYHWLNRQYDYVEENYPAMQRYIGPAIRYGVPLAGVGVVGCAFGIGCYYNILPFNVPTLKTLLSSGGIVTDQGVTHIITQFPRAIPNAAVSLLAYIKGQSEQQNLEY